MLKIRLIITLTFLDGILFRTKKFKPDYRYKKNFVEIFNVSSIKNLGIIDIQKKIFNLSKNNEI